MRSRPGSLPVGQVDAHGPLTIHVHERAVREGGQEAAPFRWNDRARAEAVPRPRDRPARLAPAAHRRQARNARRADPARGHATGLGRATLTISPISQDARSGVPVEPHRHQRREVVGCRGHPVRVHVQLPISNRSRPPQQFTHCGDRRRRWSTASSCCVSNLTVEDSDFQDCRGCDFINGRFGSNLALLPQPLRAHGAVQHGRVPLRPPGSRPAVRRHRARRPRQHLRRLLEGRGPALRHEPDAAHPDRQQPLPRHRPARCRATRRAWRW